MMPGCLMTQYSRTFGTPSAAQSHRTHRRHRSWNPFPSSASPSCTAYQAWASGLKTQQSLASPSFQATVCRQLRAPTCCRAGREDSDQKSLDPTSLEAAAASVDRIWQLVQEGNLDDLIRFIPDSVVDEAAELRPSAESDTPLTFRNVVQHAHEIKGFTFDSFAERHLYYSPPAPTRGSFRRLSCIRTAPDRAVLRYEVVVEGGERAVLTFGLECVERLEPHYRSARVEFVWQLISVVGEPAESPEREGENDDEGGGQTDGYGGGEHARRPHPSLPPEAVVQAQLAALVTEDTASVFAFASPANRAMTGPLERFVTLLRNPMYRPLLRHRKATPYRRTMVDRDSYSEVVKIVSDNTGMPQAIEMVYLWELSRQGPDAESYANCWMTDSVRLVAARALN